MTAAETFRVWRSVAAGAAALLVAAALAVWATWSAPPAGDTHLDRLPVHVECDDYETPGETICVDGHTGEVVDP